MVNRREIGAASLAAAALLAARTSQALDAARPSVRMPPVRIAMLLYPGMKALDVVGPQGLLAGLAPDTLHLVARSVGPVLSDTGLSLVVTTSFADCPTELDVLFVPGGDGTAAQMLDAATLAFLQDRASRTRWVTAIECWMMSDWRPPAVLTDRGTRRPHANGVNAATGTLADGSPDTRPPRSVRNSVNAVPNQWLHGEHRSGLRHHGFA